MHQARTLHPVVEIHPFNAKEHHMKRLIAALALAVLAVPAFAVTIERNSVPTEQQSGYFDPSN
jgi:hypothetical protein